MEKKTDALTLKNPLLATLHPTPHLCLHTVHNFKIPQALLNKPRVVELQTTRVEAKNRIMAQQGDE